MTGERTRPGSSQSIAAIRVRADELLPETLTPLVADDWTPIALVSTSREPATLHPAVREWLESSVETADARVARRLIRELEAA